MARPLADQVDPGVGEWYRDTVVMETPFQPFNPCVNNPLGPFLPGLILKRPFVFGPVFGVSGTNPNVPTQPAGFTVTDNTVRMSPIVNTLGVRGDLGGYEYLTTLATRFASSDFKMVNQMHFDDPPLRVPANGSISFQRLFDNVTFSDIVSPFDLSVSILYTVIEDRRS